MAPVPKTNPPSPLDGTKAGRALLLVKLLLQWVPLLGESRLQRTFLLANPAPILQPQQGISIRLAQIVALQLQVQAGTLRLTLKKLQAPWLMLAPGAVARFIRTVLKQLKTVWHPPKTSWRSLLMTTRLKRVGENSGMLLPAPVPLTVPSTAGQAENMTCVVPLLPEEYRPYSDRLGRHPPKLLPVRPISVA